MATHIGTEPQGATGTINDGHMLGGKWWYNVTFTNGLTGWIIIDSVTE